MTNTFTIISNPHPGIMKAEAEAKAQEGNADSQKLAKDWAEGKANTKDRNFVTPSDEADPRTVEEVMKKKGMAPAFDGDYD